MRTPPKPLSHDYRRGVNHRLRTHYWQAHVRSDLSAIARHDRDQTTERIELGERVQDAIPEQAAFLALLTTTTAEGV